MERVLILRVIPYNDQSKVVHCLTENNGLCTYFFRTSKRQPKGIIQVGSFIKITAITGKGQHQSIKEVAIDSLTVQHPLHPSQYALWLFVIELVSKSAQESFHIPMLLPSMATYRCLLAEGQVSQQPATPLLLLTHIYGILDTSRLGSGLPDEVISDLHALGISSEKQPQLKFDFSDYLRAFKRHFSIQQIDAAELI